MKILHVSFSDSIGGAGIAAATIHKALLARGVESRFLCCRKGRETPKTVLFGGVARKYINGLQNRLVQKVLKHSLRSQDNASRSLNLFSSGMHHWINQSDADVVNLHWINGEMISIAEIGKITKPVVWTLHDMWPFCGAEHQVRGRRVVRFRSGYSKDNRDRDDRGIDWDRWAWNRKARYWKNSRFGFIAVSDWMQKQIEASFLFKGCPVVRIHNPIDASVFKPHPQKIARKELGIPLGKKIVLFYNSNQPEKGVQIASDVAHELVRSAGEEVLVALFGSGNSDFSWRGDAAVINFGEIDEADKLAKIYSAADAYVSTSAQESFGLTVAESLACGTPVVCYRTSGLCDIVEHKVDGYMTRAYDTQGFLDGIKWILAHRDDREKCLELGGRKLFAMQDIATQYIRFYDFRLKHEKKMRIIDEFQ